VVAAVVRQAKGGAEVSAPRKRGRPKKASSTLRAAESGGEGPAIGVYSGGLVVEDINRNWEDVDALGRSAKDIANQCALLCCVQRQLGYFAALHEGAVGSGSIVSRAPPLPMVLSWEGKGGVDEVYAMGLAPGGKSNLLQQLLGCVKECADDVRWGVPSSLNRQAVDLLTVTAKVSLLRGFEDISADPENWTLGTHGLWYSRPLRNGDRSTRVYLPEVAQRIAGVSAESVDDEDDAAEEYDQEAGVQKVLQALAGWDGGEKEEKTDDAAEEADEEFDLPSGSKLYRFEALSGKCPVSNLPTMKVRIPARENQEKMLVAQSRIQDGDFSGIMRSGARFAALTSSPKPGTILSEASTTEDNASNGSRIRAFIVPVTGAYSNAHKTFDANLRDSRPAGLDQVRRIFVIASVWDCYIDGCGLPERRCAFYGNMPLDLVVLERLRSSRAFSELSVEQDVKERGVEVLLPLIDTVLNKNQEFTIVPVLVGGLMSDKAEQYAKLLAPYLADPTNLFVVSGDVDALGDGLEQIPTDRVDSWGKGENSPDDLPAGLVSPNAQQTWEREVPILLNQKDRLLPIFDALELFLSVLAQSPQKEQLSLNRYF